jgi:hypothetical protein
MEMIKTVLRRVYSVFLHSVRRSARLLWQILDAGVFLVSREFAVLRREGRLALGVILTLVGVLNFQAEKFCDGNTALYNACARPVVYYMYPWWAILFVVLGALLFVGYWKRK